MKTILEIIRLSTDYLTNCSIGNARREAEQLIADVLGMQRMHLYMHHDRPLEEKEMALCREVLKRRGAGEPSQYIRGKVDFFDCSFTVTTDVLIPRQETEILVDKISRYLSAIPNLHQKKLWDICTGSGCIGIALKKRFPELQVTLSDISEKALAVAKKNAEAAAVEVEVLQGDLFHPFQGRKTDFLVCNPPYIAEKEYESLEREVKNFEPKLALIAGETGEEIYRRMAQDLRKFIQSPGKAWFEIGTNQGNALIDLFKSSGFDSILLEKDWSGQDRFFSLEFD